MPKGARTRASDTEEKPAEEAEVDHTIAEQEAAEDEAFDGRTVVPDATATPVGTPTASVAGTRVHPSMATAEQLKQQSAADQHQAGLVAPVAAPDHDAEERVIFHMNDIATPERIFSREDHGDDFLAVANEFAATHAGKIISREDI